MNESRSKLQAKALFPLKMQITKMRSLPRSHAQDYIPWGVLQADCVKTRQF